MWRIRGLLSAPQAGLLAVGGAALWVPDWLVGLDLALDVLGTMLAWRWASHRFERFGSPITEEVLRVRDGVLIHTDMAAPVFRVQHPDIARGPMERQPAPGLSTLVVHTAAPAADTTPPGTRFRGGKIPTQRSPRRHARQRPATASRTSMPFERLPSIAARRARDGYTPRLHPGRTVRDRFQSEFDLCFNEMPAPISAASSSLILTQFVPYEAHATAHPAIAYSRPICEHYATDRIRNDGARLAALAFSPQARDAEP